MMRASIAHDAPMEAHDAVSGAGPTQDIAADEDSVFTFPEGLLGFPELRRFTLEATELDGVYWLQSLECEPLSFVLADPFTIVPGYEIDLGEGELGPFRNSDPASIGLLTILNIREGGAGVTANLQGPVVVDMNRRQGRQIVLRESPYGVSWPVELERRARAG
jgi:flagellar assembly factor FliW